MVSNPKIIVTGVRGGRGEYRLEESGVAHDKGRKLVTESFG